MLSNQLWRQLTSIEIDAADYTTFSYSYQLSTHKTGKQVLFAFDGIRHVFGQSYMTRLKDSTAPFERLIDESLCRWTPKSLNRLWALPGTLIILFFNLNDKQPSRPGS
jgi:hypothetical protein